jgi:hypothetical protein
LKALGLRLERRRSPIDVIVVKSIDRTPTANQSIQSNSMFFARFASFAVWIWDFGIWGLGFWVWDLK